MKLVILHCLLSVSITSSMNFMAPENMYSNDIDRMNEPRTPSPDQNLNEMLKKIFEQKITEDQAVYSDLSTCTVKAIVSFVACMHSDKLQDQTDPLPFLKCFSEASNVFVKCLFSKHSSRTISEARWTNIPKP